MTKCKVFLVSVDFPNNFLFDPGARLSKSHIRGLVPAVGAVLDDARVLQQHRPGEALRLKDRNSGHGLRLVMCDTNPSYNDVIAIIKLSSFNFCKGNIGPN